MAVARSSRVLSPVMPPARPRTGRIPAESFPSPSSPIRMWRFPASPATTRGSRPLSPVRKTRACSPTAKTGEWVTIKRVSANRAPGNAEPDQAPLAALEAPVRTERDGGEDLAPVRGPSRPHVQNLSGHDGVGTLHQLIERRPGVRVSEPSSVGRRPRCANAGRLKSRIVPATRVATTRP